MEDLEDMLSVSKVGAKNIPQTNKPTGQIDDLDELEDMLDGIGNQKTSYKKASPRKIMPSASEDDIDDLWGGPKLVLPPV